MLISLKFHDPLQSFDLDWRDDLHNFPVLCLNSFQLINFVVLAKICRSLLALAHKIKDMRPRLIETAAKTATKYCSLYISDF